MLSLLASPAFACAVCGAGTADDQTGYVSMTVFMSLTPLAMFAGLGWWLYRNVTSAAAEQ